MQYRLEFADDCTRDLELIFDHLFENYVRFGESTEQALDHAAQRILGIRAEAERLTIFPIRGTARDDLLPGLRYVAMDRAVYWFDVDSRARKIRVVAIFFGGQDHIRRMLIRLLGTDPPASRKD